MLQPTPREIQLADAHSRLGESYLAVLDYWLRGVRPSEQERALFKAMAVAKEYRELAEVMAARAADPVVDLPAAKRDWTEAEMAQLTTICQAAATRHDNLAVTVLLAAKRLDRTRISIRAKINALGWYEHGRWNWVGMKPVS